MATDGRQVRISFERPQKLDAKQAADLVGALNESDALTYPVLAHEIGRRIGEVRTTLLAYRYLSPRNDEDREDAHGGLVGCSFRAVGKLYAPTNSHSGSGRSERYESTLPFIEKVLEKFFAPYKALQPEEILIAALSGKFRYIGNHVRHRLIDYIRRFKAVERRLVKRKERRELLATRTTTQRAKETYRPIPRLFDIFIDKEERYKPQLGDKNWETLLLLKDAAEKESPRHPRDFKGKSTRMIAERRKVSLRQARADKKQLDLKACEIARSNHRKHEEALVRIKAEREKKQAAAREAFSRFLRERDGIEPLPPHATSVSPKKYIVLTDK